MNEMQWVDGPFFDLLSQINSLAPFFLKQSKNIAYILMLINVIWGGINYAITKQGLKDKLVKMVVSYSFFIIIISNYPTIMNGINMIIYKWTMNSTWTEELQQVVNSTRNDADFWARKTDESDYAYSDIIKEVSVSDANGTIGYKYILDLTQPGTSYLSPNSVMRLVMMCGETIFKTASRLPKNNFGFVKDLGQWFFLMLCALVILFCGIFAALQYFIAVLEFALIISIGSITLPGMLMNGTKFMTEKFYGAIFGFFLKLLFVSICLLLTCTGFLSMMTKEFTGAFDQIVYMLFTSIFYFMICQNGPKVALSMLTGVPQMSLMEGAAAVGTFGAAGAIAGKATGKTASTLTKGAVTGAGALSKAGSAAQTTANLAAGGKGDKFMAGMGGFMASMGNSASNTIKGGLHGLGNNLKGGNKSSSFNGNKSGNRFSQVEKMNATSQEPGKEGQRKTTKEYLNERKNEGATFAVERIENKKLQEKQLWKDVMAQKRKDQKEGVYAKPERPSTYKPKGDN